ncbi:MAG: metallophosphoesterase family protein [Deltaproteobacteria bacterium]|nr:metallophosphoesterase family protein [Deltaproteobacteria bacterium]MBW1920139.1 metallophosphoesterase family protein [Deltaproteobacteria bacterium]MBW1934303.1 metallophosphoesterase family protein [Deltaproteobacteria bacterium]MBW1977272.1 metallophosphoesterase family protein [Deltaproteobacteria bacterium]MBW2043836.1 metallophosphoesterase family protein [Deltaproteobacteria bacterium]
MKIGVISDTHLIDTTPLLEETVKKYFSHADLILHAGDLTSMSVLDAFAGKEVIAVSGNCDSSQVKQMLPDKKVVEVSNFRIGLIHGWGLPFGLERKLGLHFQGIHCLVYGHSHWPTNHYNNGILYFNPGSFSRGLFSLWRRSIGLLDIEGKHIEGRIIRF